MPFPWWCATRRPNAHLSLTTEICCEGVTKTHTGQGLTRQPPRPPHLQPHVHTEVGIGLEDATSGLWNPQALTDLPALVGRGL